MVNVVLAGGGTAGHTSPLIATAEQIRALDPEATLTAIGTPKGLESRVIPAAGLDLKMISPVPMPRKPSAELAMVPMKLRKAINEAKDVLTRADADVLVGFGGYVSMPAYFAARSLKLPIVVHEQNALPGLANKVAAKFTDQVYVSFPDTPLKGGIYIGLPVRRTIAELDRASLRAEARKHFDLDPDKPTLLVSGGSQGAASINKAVKGAKDRLTAEGIQILHVLGQKNFTDDMFSETNEETGAAYLPVAYVEKMELAYAAADLMLGRSGAGTVVETAVIGLPTIFVPFPHGNGEQAKNAEALVAAGGARLVEDSACTADWLLAEVPGMLADTGGLQAMSRASSNTVPGNAAEVLARRVLDIAKR